MSSNQLSLGQSLNQAIFGPSNASSASATSTGKAHHGHGHRPANDADSSASASDPASVLMQTIQSALAQTGVSAPGARGAVDPSSSTTGVHIASATPSSSASKPTQVGLDADGDQDGSAGTAASGGAQQSMHQFMHALMTAVNSVASSNPLSGATASSPSNNPYSSIASNVQTLLGQLSANNTSANSSGASSTGGSNSTNPALQALSSAFQNLLDVNSPASNTNPLGIPQGLPGTQPTLQEFLQNLESSFMKGTAASSPALSSVGSLMNATA